MLYHTAITAYPTSHSPHFSVVLPLYVWRRRWTEPCHAREVDGGAAVNVHVGTAQDLGVRFCKKMDEEFVKK